MLSFPHLQIVAVKQVQFVSSPTREERRSRVPNAAVQGARLSPRLFNAYSHEVAKETMIQVWRVEPRQKSSVRKECKYCLMQQVLLQLQHLLLLLLLLAEAALHLGGRIYTFARKRNLHLKTTSES